MLMLFFFHSYPKIIYWWMIFNLDISQLSILASSKNYEAFLWCVREAVTTKSLLLLPLEQDKIQFFPHKFRLFWYNITTNTTLLTCSPF